MQAREVLVTGYGLVAPTALDAASLFTTISENRSCIGQHPAFVELGFANPAAGFIDEQQWQVIAAAFPGDLQTTSARNGWRITWPVRRWPMPGWPTAHLPESPAVFCRGQQTLREQ